LTEEYPGPRRQVFELGATPEEDAGFEGIEAENPVSIVAEGLLPAIKSGRQDGN
jgi:hypothetical protein